DHLREECRAIGALKFHLSALEALEELILGADVELREWSVGIGRATIFIECRQARAILMCGPALGLRALLRYPRQKRRLVVEPVLPAIRTGELTIDEHRASRIFSAGRLRIRRDDAVGHRLDRATFGAAEEKPRPGLHSGRWISRIRPPRKLISDRSRAGR